MNTIDLDVPVAEVLAKHPELLDILVGLGFTPLSNPVMLKTVGKVTSLRRGSSLAHIPLDKIVSTLIAHGYEVKGADHE